MTRFSLLAVSAALLLSGTAALADGGPSIQEEVLSECYLFAAPIAQQSLTGRAGDSDDSGNPCYTGYYSGQSLNYDYRTRQQVLLVIATSYAAPTTQQITREMPAAERYDQPNQCESREQFAAEALAYFTAYYSNLQISFCQ